MNSDINADARKDPDRLEREIDQQRHEINETLRALEERFSSREIANQLMHYLSEPGREWAGNLGSALKANPVPAVLTAIGLAWLMMSDRQGAPRHAYTPADYARSGPGVFRETAASARDAADTVRQKAGELGDRAAHVGDALGEKAAHMGDSLRARAHNAREDLGYTAMNARAGFEHMRREQPLALGAIGIALGALLGCALPRTEQEQRVLGRASERMREKGKEMAREGYEKASQKVDELAAKVGTSPSL